MLEAKSIKLASRLLDMCFKKDKKKLDGLRMAEHMLSSGKALTKFREIIKYQKGNPDIMSSQIKKGKYKTEIKSEFSGTIRGVNNYHVSALAKILGAPTDRYAGLVLHHNIDNKVKKNDILMELYSQSKSKLNESLNSIKNLTIYDIK